jgi:hypothetical protein
MNLQNEYYDRDARSDNAVNCITISFGSMEGDSNEFIEKDSSSKKWIASQLSHRAMVRAVNSHFSQLCSAISKRHSAAQLTFCSYHHLSPCNSLSTM